MILQNSPRSRFAQLFAPVPFNLFPSLLGHFFVLHKDFTMSLHPSFSGSCRIEFELIRGWPGPSPTIKWSYAAASTRPVT